MTSPIRQLRDSGNWIRRKLHRLRLGSDMRHMRSVHPDFRIIEKEGGGHWIHWKKAPVGEIRPLHELTPPETSDCFIIGTGPSINDMDLSPLRSRTCFGVNGSVLKSDELGLRFSYHLITDRRFFLDRFDLVRRVLRSGSDCLFSFRGLSIVCERAPGLLREARIFLVDEVNARYGQPQLSPEAFDLKAAGNTAFALHPQVRLSHGRVGFSRDIHHGVFTGQTVVYSALQTACWLGFKRIFILGMDLGGSSRDTRFYESGSAAAPMRLDSDYEPFIKPAFEVAREVLDEQGIELYNLSIHSRLPSSIVPKLSWSEALRMTAS